MVISIAMILVSLLDHTPQETTMMKKINEKPSWDVKIGWTLLIIVMIALYVFFNGR
jgi:hypothetical protein